MKSKLVSDSNRIVHINMDAVNAYTSKWVPGTAFDFEIVRKVQRKSDPIRKYYFGVVMPVALETFGYDAFEKDIVHKQLKIRYFDVKPDRHGIYRDKDIPPVFADDSHLTDKERKKRDELRKKFTEAVIRLVASEGGYVPEPGEK
jgi:hypothetical protein